MQNYCKTIGALAAASALAAGNASAEIEYELHTGYTNEYLFRGVSLGLDLVETGFDVATEWNNVGLSAGVWYANYDANRVGINVNEIDLYAEASYDFNFLKAAVGYIYYYNELDDLGEAFFGSADDTQEVYFSLSRDFGFAEAALTYYWDVSGDNDGYSEFGLTRSFELNSCLTLNLGSNVSFIIEPGEWGAWTTKVGLDWEFVERAKLSPFVALAIPLSDEDNTYYDGSENEFVAGSMLSVSF